MSHPLPSIIALIRTKELPNEMIPEEDEDEEAQMMKLMGFGGFDSTKVY
jgi:hypothetical protein